MTAGLLFAAGVYAAYAGAAYVSAFGLKSAGGILGAAACAAGTVCTAAAALLAAPHCKAYAVERPVPDAE